MAARALPLDRAALRICSRCGYCRTIRSPRRIDSADYGRGTSGRADFERIYLAARNESYARGLDLAGSAQGRAVLDLGCGYGHFLAMAEREGWRVSGVEPAESVRTQALEQVRPFIHADLALIEPQAKFDLLTLWDVLEHLDDPFEELTRGRNLLKPAGTILVRVPDARVFCRLTRGWPTRLALHPYLKLAHPTNPEEHLHHFTPTALSLVAEKVGLASAGAIESDRAERVASGRTRLDSALRSLLHRLGSGLPYEFTMLFRLAPR
jgi:SAM-dependent methyltransferase